MIRRCDSPSASVTIDPSSFRRDFAFVCWDEEEDGEGGVDRNWECFCMILDAITVDANVIDERCTKLIVSSLSSWYFFLVGVFIVKDKDGFDGKCGNIDVDDVDVTMFKSSLDEVGDVDKEGGRLGTVLLDGVDGGGGGLSIILVWWVLNVILGSCYEDFQFYLQNLVAAENQF